MKLIDITLINFRKISSIPKPTIAFNPDINVLVGANNSGKTSILKAIQKIFRTDHIAESDVNYLVQDGNLILEATVLITKEQWRSYLTIALGSSLDLGLNQVNISALAEELEPFSIKLRHNMALIKGKRSNYQVTSVIDDEFFRDGPSGAIRTLVQRALNNFALTDFYNVYKTPLYLDSKGKIQAAEAFVPLNQIKSNQPQGNINIRGLLYALKKDNPKEFAGFKTRLLSIFTELEDIDVRNNEDQGVFELVLHEKLKRNGAIEEVRYDINNVGLGMQSMVLMLSNILLLKPSIVLMDEPEVHMHPALIKEFINYIKALSIDTQFIITTHSVVLMQEAGLDKLFSLKNEIEHRGITISKVEDRNKLLEAVDGLGYPVDTLAYTLRPAVFVFTEGPSDKDLILEFAKKAGLEHKLNTFTVGFVAMGGKGNRVKLANLIEKLNEEFIDSPLIMILDRDETVADKVEDLRQRFFRKNPKRLHYLSKRQIENYLINKAAITKTVVGKIKSSELLKKWESENLTAKILELAELQREKINNYLSEIFITDSLVSTKELGSILKSISTKPLNQSVPEFTGELFRLIGIRTSGLGQKSSSAINEFEAKWNDGANKIEMCDGRELLRSIRKWLEDDYKISFTDSELVDAMPQIPGEIQSLLEQLLRPEELKNHPV